MLRQTPACRWGLPNKEAGICAASSVPGQTLSPNKQASSGSPLPGTQPAARLRRLCLSLLHRPTANHSWVSDAAALPWGACQCGPSLHLHTRHRQIMTPIPKHWQVITNAHPLQAGPLLPSLPDLLLCRHLQLPLLRGRLHLHSESRRCTALPAAAWTAPCFLTGRQRGCTAARSSV